MQLLSQLLNLTGSLLPLSNLPSFSSWVPSNPLVSGGGVVPLPPNQWAEFVPYIEFARAAYCKPSKIAGWKCGGACRAVPGFEPTLRGGDGDEIQYYYVGFWPAQSAVVVAHQGTDPLELKADLTDLEIEFVALDPTLFPNVPSDVQVHLGFATEHKKTASLILAEVKNLMAKYSSTHVILIGHSLGGALAELDTLYMRLNLPGGTRVQGATFGTPRVGNAAWATFFDAQVTEFKRVNNKRDLVPTLPPYGLGFRHPSGEIHIDSSGNPVVCPGPDDDVDPGCSDLTVPTFLEGSLWDHLGPYQGIFIGTIFCTP